MSRDELFLAELLRALEEAKLEAIVVGMTAAVLQGAPVMTQDVDLLIRDTPRNREKLEKMRTVLGAAKPAEVSPLSKPLVIMGAALPVDILFERLSGGLAFAGLRARAVRIVLSGRTAVVACLADVIKSKEAAGRSKDQAALPILRDTLRVQEALKAQAKGRK